MEEKKSQALQLSNNTSIPTSIIKLRLPVEDEDGVVRTANLEVDNSIRVHENKEFAKAIIYLIATMNGNESMNSAETWLFMESCRNNDVRPLELYTAFWEATGDEYVGKDGIQFKHLMKYIKRNRALTYTLPEEGISMALYQKQNIEKLVGKEGAQKLLSGEPVKERSLLTDEMKKLEQKMKVK